MAIIPGEQKNISIGTPQEQKQKKMVYLLILVILLIAGVLYFGFFRGSTAPSVSPAPAVLPAGQTAGTVTGTVPVSLEPGSENQKFLESLKAVNLEVPLFKDKKFQALSLYGEWPISQGAKGRENPFEPY